MMTLSYENLDELCRSKLGKHDVACPLCGPDRRDPANRKRRVLRIWHTEPGFASYHCARCGERGWGRSGGEASRPVDMNRRPQDHANEARELARGFDHAMTLWSGTVSLHDNLGCRYFAEQRDLRLDSLGLDDVLRWHPAINAIIALMTHPVTNQPTGVHRIFLNPDGSKRERKMRGCQGVIRPLAG